MAPSLAHRSASHSGFLPILTDQELFKMRKSTLFSAIAVLVATTVCAAGAFAVETGTAAVAPQPAVTAPITKEQATDMALKAHPGKVIKAYEDTKKGKKTWEVKIQGDDGKKWEIYYEITTGLLVAEEGK
ncbi:MAG: PepSY domain-containing protein [Candidatus Competibacter denitrificans]|jgi:uncharacterized membrane protein YkoI